MIKRTSVAAARLVAPSTSSRTHLFDSEASPQQKGAKTSQEKEKVLEKPLEGSDDDPEYTAEELREKILRNYGPGSQPLLRQAAIDCILFAYFQAPKDVLFILRVISHRASLASKPEHYFFAAIKRELVSKGLWESAPVGDF